MERELRQGDSSQERLTSTAAANGRRTEVNNRLHQPRLSTYLINYLWKIPPLRRFLKQIQIEDRAKRADYLSSKCIFNLKTTNISFRTNVPSSISIVQCLLLDSLFKLHANTTSLEKCTNSIRFNKNKSISLFWPSSMKRTHRLTKSTHSMCKLS